MTTPDPIARPEMLRMLTGGLIALLGSVGLFAQSSFRIERLAPELDAILSVSEPVRELVTGLGTESTEGGPAEGPVWWKEGGYLLFSDIGNNRRLKYVPGQRGTSVFAESTNRANGLTRDMQGRLVATEGGAQRVARIEPDGRTTVVADTFEGKPIERSNDVVVKSDGAIYFTALGRPRDQTRPVAEQPPPPGAGVYRVSPDLRTVTRVVDDLLTPNGLAFSPDERILYVNDSQRRRIDAFNVKPDGSLDGQRPFVDLGGPEEGNPDGMKVDTAGNVYCGGAGGLYIVDRSGKRLGRIAGVRATNVAFGGDDWKTLYFTTRTTLGSVRLKIAGLPVPARAIR